MSETNTLSTARLIGAIFLERGLVTDEQLQAALAIQAETKEHLGEILVQHFGVPRIELASVLAEQWADLEQQGSKAPPEQPLPAPAEEVETATADRDTEESGGLDERRPLGEIFVEQGLVTDEELDQALEVQRSGGQKLGEILVAQGSITRLQLASALADQWTALRKIRPPSSAELPPSVPGGTTREEQPREVEGLREAVDALELRLRVAESVATREPWREEIGRASEDLQTSLAEVESRLASAATREDLTAVEGLQATVEELTARVEGLASRELANDADLARRVEAAAEAAESARSGLGGAFESLSLRLADVEARVHDRTELSSLQSGLEALGQQVAGLTTPESDTDLDELRGEVTRLLDEVERRGAGASEPDPALSQQVDSLAKRIDEIADAFRERETAADSRIDTAALEEALTAIAERVRVLESDDHRARESTLAERLSLYEAKSDQLAEVQDRLGELERRTEEVAESNPWLTERLDGLATKLQALEQGDSRDEVVEIRRRLEELAARPAGDPALADRVEEVSRDLSDAISASQPELEALRARVDELASRPAGDPALAERIDELARRLSEAVSSHPELDALHARVDELAARPTRDSALAERVEELALELERPRAQPELEALAARVDELASRPAGDPALAGRVDELARELREVVSSPHPELEALGARVEELAARPIRDPALAERVEELARELERPPTHPELEALSARVDELASRPAGDPALAERVDELARELHEVVSSPHPELEALRARLDELAARPTRDPALAERVEELAHEIEHARALPELEALQVRMEELAARPAGDPKLAERIDELARELRQIVTSSGSELEALRSRVEAIAARPVADPALAETVEALQSELARLDNLGTRIEEVERGSASIGKLRRRIDELGGELEAVAAAPREELEALRARVDELASRPTGDATLSASIERIRSDLEDLAASTAADRTAARERFEAIAEELGRSLEDVREHIDAVETAAAETPSDEHGTRIEMLERRLDAGESREAAFGARVEEAVVRLAALDELRLRLDQLDERVGEHEGASAAHVRKDELSAYRRDLGKELRALQQRCEDLEAAAPAERDSLLHALEEAVSALRRELEGHRLELVDRVTASEYAATALRDEVAVLQAAANTREGWRDGIESDVRHRIDKLGRKLAADLRAEQPDLAPALAEVKADVASLAGRLEETDASLERKLEELAAELKQVRKSHARRLDELQHARATADDQQLQARIDSLERRLEGEAARAEEQVRVTESALRDGLHSLGERLADTSSTYVEAGDALRRSIERLGASIVEADGLIGDRAATPATAAGAEEMSGPCLAFVPNGSGYSLRELDVAPPAVGERISIAENEGEFVVTRVGRSPLPLDRRRCLFLEAA